MRIPWYISIPLCLTVVIITLWLSSRGYDFTQEPTPAELAEIAESWRAKYPSLSPDGALAAENVTFPDTNTGNSDQPVAPPLHKLPIGDLNISPALDHYIHHRQAGSAAMIYLAQRLEEKKEPRFALLAWERVLDSTQPSPQQVQLAAEAITKLRVDLPLWNADTEANRPIILHLALPEQWKLPISSRLEGLSDTIREASGNIITVQIMIKTVPQREGFPPPPVSLWLSGIGDAAKESPKITFHIKTNAEKPTDVPVDQIANQLFTALYRALSSELKRQDLLTTPADLLPSQNAYTALHSQFTRLHWYQLSSKISD